MNNGRCRHSICPEAKAEIAKEIIGIIKQRMENNTERLNGCQSDIWKIGYLARKEAYLDIKEIIEQKYLEDCDD